MSGCLINFKDQTKWPLFSIRHCTCIFLIETMRILIRISLKLVPNDPIENISQWDSKAQIPMKFESKHSKFYCWSWISKHRVKKRPFHLGFTVLRRLISSAIRLVIQKVLWASRNETTYALYYWPFTLRIFYSDITWSSNHSTIFSTVCSGIHKRKHLSFALLALCVRNPQLTSRFPHKRSVTRKAFPHLYSLRTDC